MENAIEVERLLQASIQLKNYYDTATATHYYYYTITISV